MAGFRQVESGAGRRARSAGRQSAWQQLRVHPAHPDAVQRADLGRAFGRGSKGVWRRPRHADGHRTGDRGRDVQRRRCCGRARGADHWPADAGGRPRPRSGGEVGPLGGGRPTGGHHGHRRHRGGNALRGRSPRADRRPPGRPPAQRCRPTRRPADPATRRSRRQRPHRAAARSGAHHHRGGPEPDQPRERQAPRGGDGQRPRS